MASPVVTRKAALLKPTHHQFVPGIGYISHTGLPELPSDARGDKNCDPPAGSKDGSAHLFNPPTGGKMVELHWVAAEKAWASPDRKRGNRLAWPVAHLRKAGWEYARAK